ncbi:kinesin-like protein KIF20B isoform X2 [Mytilus californianus]|uniref:kinesin-like protein KIF20B isoform X2 n=1 Tax=Mytilus californianus TaxID=6549 RepID=UPI0022451CA0|nr:kinesin-like protein KIF20B isoform X2 [Mytilus californianus]
MAGRTRLHSDVVFGDTAQDDDISFRNPKKRILFDEESTNTPVEISEHMKCYLRIRPFSEEEVDSKEDQKCLTIEDEHTVATHAPKESHTFKNCTHGLGKTTHKFKFSRIFDSVTTQKDFFNETMLGLVKDFIDGQNCLVFTYGVTSSGKTYTIQGKPKDAGILPRALDVLFNSINGKQWPNNNLKPKMFMDVTRLSSDQAAQEIKIKERTLKMVTFDEPDVMSLLGDDASDMSIITNTTTCSESSNVSYGPAGRTSKDSLDEVFSDLENRVREEAAVNVEDQGLMKFSVWVSFAEIYNEQIFDLLEPIPKKKTTRRPVLRLSDDRNGSPYIRGLKEIHVTSADEAYNLLTVGQKNLRTAVTKLNHQSSRSHCIFNIKILRVVDKGNPNHARVSMLSLCDLAGSERHSKTQSKGDRLKEAGNINTSLMTLGRCIEALRNNQHHKDKTQLIPFRDSKLTRLFQNFFSGRGKAAMIVNVNQCASMFDETLHVFKFSAVAKQVVVVQKPEPPPKKRLKSAPPPKVPRPSIPWATPGAADMSLMNSALKRGQQIPLPEDDFDDDMDSDSMDDSESAELVRIIDSLREKLKDEKRVKLLMERDIREEVCKEMMEQIVKIENDYEEQLREREILAEEMMEKRIKILTNSINPRKRPRQEVMEDEDDEWVSSILLHQEKVKVQEKDEELEGLKKELETTKSQLNIYIKEQENYIAKNTSLQFKLADTEQVLEQAQKDKEEAKEEVKKVNNKMDELVTNTVEKRKSDIDLGDTCLLETLSQQLQQAKDQIKEQETEIKELNAMLTEAGETFQQTDTEIKQLKEVINDDEEKLKQQQILISELQTALEESTNAVTNAEERLIKKDEQIVKMESENSEFEEKLKSQKNCCLFLEETLKQKDEEITGWKNKFAREEDESFKREHALINGYKAEINNLKTQIHQLKAERKMMSPMKNSPSMKCKEILSPSKCLKETESPRKTRVDSPVRKLRSNAHNCGSEEKNHHFKENLSRQIKDLQAEFMKNSSVTAKLESALHIARLTSEDLESRLEAEQKHKLEAFNKLEELTTKMRDLENTKSQLEKEVEKRKKSDEQVEKLKLELKELDDIHNSFKELQNNFGELEKKMATKVEENLTATSKVQTLESEVDKFEKEKVTAAGQIDTLQKDIERLEREKNEADSKIHDLQNNTDRLEREKDECVQRIALLQQNVSRLSVLEDKVNKLEQDVLDAYTINKDLEETKTKLELNLEHSRQEIREKSETTTSIEKYVQQLKEELSSKDIENTNLAEKLEEMETVNLGLREMVNQTTNHILEKETEIKEIVVESLQSCDSPSSDSLTNIRKKMRDLKQECEKIRIESENKSQEVEHLKKELEKSKNSNMENGNEMKKLVENCKDLDFQLEEKSIEITDMIESKVAIETKVNELECKVSEVECLSKEKTIQLMELNDELNKVKVAKEMLEADVRDLEEEKEELQALVETNSSLKKDNENLEKDILDEQRTIEDLSEVLQKKQKEKGEYVLKLEDQITDLKNGELSKEESHKQKVTLLDQEISKLKNELEEKCNRIEELNKEIDNKSESVCEKDKRLEEIEAQLKENVNLTTQLQSEQKEINQRIENAEVESDTFNKQINDIRNEKESLEKEHEQLVAKCSELENLTVDLKKRNETSSAENGSLSQQIECINQEKQTLQTDLDRLKIKCNELESCSSQSETSDNEQSSRSVAKLQIAELKSSLHMHKTLHENAKSEVLESEERITELEKEIETLKSKLISVKDGDDVENVDDEDKECLTLKKEHESSLNKLELDLENKNVEIENLKKQVDSLQQESLEKTESCDKLKCELEVKNSKVQSLREDLDSLKQYKSKSEKSLKEMDHISKMCKQHEILIHEQDLKIKSFEKCDSEKQVLVEEVEHIESKCEKLEKEKSKLKIEIDGCKFQKEVSDREMKNLNEAISQQQKLICQQSEKMKELVQCDGSVTISNELDTLKSDLKSKSEKLEHHKDKLTKVENDLVRINYELHNKEQIIGNLKENLNQFRENECLSPTSQSHCARKLRKEKIEVENQLIEAKFKIKQLENEVHSGVMSSPRRMVHTESIQRASVTSPTVHRELNRSQEREQNLRSQLQQASQTVKQQNEKISELEKQLLDTSTKLRAAEDSLKQRQSLYGVPQDSCVQEDMKRLREEHAKRWEIIQNLEKDLQKKESKLQSKSQVVKDLKQTMEMERDKFEAALRDANANEAVIEELKNAIALQEETMEEQDRYIQQKEETISKLQQDVEKYTDKYHQLLTSSGDSGREMREMTRENVRQSAEVDQFKKNVEELKSKLQKMQEENLKLSDTFNVKCKELSELESLLKEKREECDKLHSSTKEDNCEDLEKTVEELKRNNQKLKDDKLLLNIVIKENNDELKEMEKLVSERRKECEELKSQNNTDKLETVESKNKEQEHVITELKNKIKDKDHSLRDSHKEVRSINDELSKVRHDLDMLKSELKEKSNAITEFSKQVQHKNQEIIRLQRLIEDKSNELNNWKLERDKLVDGLEGIMKKQQKEINDLKKQKAELEDKQTTRHRHRSTTQHEKLIIVPDSTEDIIIKQEIPDVFQSPPRRALSRRGRKRKSPTLETPDMPSSAKKEITDDNLTFVSEDGDISHHIEIDATPAIAAKTLRKSRKKRSSVDLLREEKCDKENKKSTRGRKQRASKTTSDTPETNGKGQTKKLLEDITEASTPNKDGDTTIEVEDHGTQMSPALANKRSRRKHTLYKESLQISEPLDCGNFVGQSPDDVHTTVQRKLRGRKK